jgi:hypothetical protein
MEKAPSWVLGACTQRVAVGGDSPPWDAVCIDSILAIKDLFVHYFYKE